MLLRGAAFAAVPVMMFWDAMVGYKCVKLAKAFAIGVPRRGAFGLGRGEWWVVWDRTALPSSMQLVP